MKTESGNHGELHMFQRTHSLKIKQVFLNYYTIKSAIKLLTLSKLVIGSAVAQW